MRVKCTAAFEHLEWEKKVWGIWGRSVLNIDYLQQVQEQVGKVQRKNHHSHIYGAHPGRWDPIGLRQCCFKHSMENIAQGTYLSPNCVYRVSMIHNNQRHLNPGLVVEHAQLLFCKYKINNSCLFLSFSDWPHWNSSWAINCSIMMMARDPGQNVLGLLCCS